MDLENILKDGDKRGPCVDLGFPKNILEIMNSPVLWFLRSPQTSELQSGFVGKQRGTSLMKVCKMIVLSLFLFFP